MLLLPWGFPLSAAELYTCVMYMTKLGCCLYFQEIEKLVLSKPGTTSSAGQEPEEPEILRVIIT